MKFLDTLKQYEKLVIKENAKLQNLYASLINEAKEEGIKVDEDDILNNRPHNAHVAEGETEKTDEADTSFAEAEDQIPEDEFMEAAETEEVEEAEDDIPTAEEFFATESEDKEEEVKEGEKCPECGKDPCVCEKDDSKEEEVN